MGRCSLPTHFSSTCFKFIRFIIVAFGLGSLETCLHTLGSIGTFCTFFFINNQHYGYGLTTQNPRHQIPFARPHTFSIIDGHKNYRVSLSSDTHLSWLWVIHKIILHQSLFARPHTINIIVSQKHYKVSLSSNLHSSWLWVIHKPYFINVHLLGCTLSLSQFVTSIIGYLYPKIFVHHGYGLTT